MTEKLKDSTLKVRLCKTIYGHANVRIIILNFDTEFYFNSPLHELSTDLYQPSPASGPTLLKPPTPLLAAFT